MGCGKTPRRSQVRCKFITLKYSQKKFILKYKSKQVLALSETHCRADHPAVLAPIESYKAWHTERSGADKGGGGLTILYRDTLIAHQWTPDVPTDMEYVSKERQWLLLNSQGGRKCAFASYTATLLARAPSPTLSSHGTRTSFSSSHKRPLSSAARGSWS